MQATNSQQGGSLTQAYGAFCKARFAGELGLKEVSNLKKPGLNLGPGRVGAVTEHPALRFVLRADAKGVDEINPWLTPSAG
jgi:hypothetical protein